MVEAPKLSLGVGLRIYSGSSQATGLWCIFAINQRSHISQNLLKYLTSLQDAGYNVILVNNGRSSEKLIDAFRPFCHTVTLKPSGGRDFGGYKWGTKFLNKSNRNNAISQVIYCNDSIFVKPSAFTALLNQIKQLDDDYIGITETFEIRYHVQSWFFAVSGRTFSSPAYGRFWKRYKAYSNRTHCISNGEIKLGSTLLNAGISPYVLYTQNRIIDLIFGGTLDETLDRLMMLFRPQEYRLFMKTIRRTSFARYRDVEPVRSFLRREVLERVALANTMNNVNLVLVKCSTFPFIKKDLVYRAEYFVAQIDQSIVDWTGADAEELPEICAFYRRRGTLRWQYSFPALLARLGVI